MGKPVNTFHNLEKKPLRDSWHFTKSKQLFCYIFKDLDNSWKEKWEKVLPILSEYRLFLMTFSVNFLCNMNDQQAELSDFCHIY